MRKAIITGCNGQDGTILYDFLLKKNYKLVGIARNSIKSTFSNLKHVNIRNRQEVFDIVEFLKPDEIYHLAAFHHSSEDSLPDDYELFQKSFEVNVISLLNFLDAIKKLSPKTRLFYSVSSQIFGDVAIEPQDENTSINPNNIYGITKSAGLFISRFYRKKYRLFVSVGILYNHESKFRKPNFVSQKIIQGAIDIKNKKISKLKIGDLDSEVDWGYAPEYVEAMWLMLQQAMPEDFVVATGEKHTIRDFINIVFEYLNLGWEQHIGVDKNIINKKIGGGQALVGNPRKIKEKTGWTPSVNFEQMVNLLVAEKLKLMKK